jgi:MFS family permease
VTRSAAILLVVIEADTPIGLLVLAYVVFGIGFGMINAPITNTAVSGMPLAQAGVASAVASTSRQVGSALGVAVLGSLVLARVHGPVADGFADASRVGWGVMLGCGLVILVLAVVGTGPWARRTADRTAELFESPAPVPAAVR